MNQQLYQILELAASQNPVERKPAEIQLEQWEKCASYHLMLQKAALDSNLPLKTRSLAIICLKNGISKYWRKTAPNAIQQDEKIQIRNNLASHFSEQNKQLATQFAVVIGKIARFDYPNEWPDLLNVLIPAVEHSFASSSPEMDHIQFNTIYTLHLTMKQLATKTLPTAKKHLRDITPQVFRFVLGIFQLCTKQYFESPMGELADNVLNKSRIALKCMRRLLIYGFENISSSEDALNLLASLYQYLPKFMEIRGSLPPSSNGLYNTLSKMSILVGKVYLDLASEHVVDFILAPGCLLVVKYYWSLLEAASSWDATLEKILIQGLKLIKTLVKHPKFTQVSSKLTERTRLAETQLEQQLFTKEFVIACVQLLISKFLALSQEDLEMWNDDPESFVQEEETDHWEYHVRACAEKVYMVVLSKNRELLGPIIMDTLLRAPEPVDLKSLLLRDSIYTSVGAGAYDLFDYLNFDDWVTKVLINESQSKSKEHAIIRRRISWLIGKWIPVKASKSIRPMLLQILLHLLRNDEDLVVRLTAIGDLRIAVDDFDFEPIQFQPLIPLALEAFLHLLNDVDEFESKMKVLQCLIVIAERMEGQIIPYIGPILTLIPQLWDRSEGQNLFRTSIVTILTKLVKSARSESFRILHMIIPILRQSLDTSNPGHLYMFEEGLELWLAVVQNSTSCNADLLSLLPTAISLLQYGSESLKRILRIIEGYVILDGRLVLESYAQPITEAIALMLGELKPAASNSLLRCMDIILQASYHTNVFPSMARVIYTGPLIAKLMKVILEKEELSVVIVGYLILVLRMIIYDAELFAKVLSNQNCLAQFMDVLLDKFDNMGQLKQRKMAALGLAFLIGTGNQEIIQRLEPIFVVIVSVSIQVRDLDKEESLLYTYAARDEDDDETSLEKERRDEFFLKDVVLTENSLSQTFKSQLEKCQTRIPSVLELISRMDQEVVKSLQHI